MGEWLGAIGQVTGPLTLIAFLSVVFLALFRRSVRDERGLEYLYRLMSDKLSRRDFYNLAMRALNLMFISGILIFTLGVGGFVLLKLNQGGEPSSSKPQVSGNTVSGDVIAIDSGSPVVATRGSQISLGGSAAPSAAKPQAKSGGQYSQIIQREGGNLILSGDGSERIRVPNAGERVDGELRLSEAYRIDIKRGHRTTQALRDLYTLEPMASPEAMESFEVDTLRISPDLMGVYAFTVPWVVGEANFTQYPFAPMSGGSAILEVHKRPTGVFAVVGFVSQSEAEALAAMNTSQQMVEVELMTAPVADSRAAVSIPLERIDSVLLGGMGMQNLEMGVDVIPVRVW